MYLDWFRALGVHAKFRSFLQILGTVGRFPGAIFSYAIAVVEEMETDVSALLPLGPSKRPKMVMASTDDCMSE